MALNFYFQLPQAHEVIEQYIKMPIEKDKLAEAIDNGSTDFYREIMAKSTAEVDEYADDYEELEQIPLYILNAFEHAVADNANTASTVELFLDIINTLDYYENFTEEPGYWNLLLEKEVAYQVALLKQLENKEQLDVTIYDKHYKDVDFAALDT